MKIVKLLALSLVPIMSVVLLFPYVTIGGSPAANVAWGAERAQQSPVSACQDPVYRQHDFVLGVWRVKINPGRWWTKLSLDAREALAHGDRRALNGETFATAKFERIVDGCVILHTWTPMTPGQNTGMALIRYAPSEKKWHYFWAGNGGEPLNYTGSIEKPGLVQYYFGTSGKDGGERFSYEALPNGRIRELGEASADGGKTWTTEYDLIWTKVAPFASAADVEDRFAAAYGNTVIDTMPDGSKAVLYINPDHTWEERTGDGKTVKGTYAWRDDHTACFTVADPPPQDPSQATSCNAVEGHHKVGDTWTEQLPDHKGAITTTITAGR